MIDYKDLLGAPFKSHGRNAQEGFDCWGLAVELMKRHGKTLPDFWNNENPPCCFEKIEKAEEGAIAYMSAFDTRRHIAICLGNGLIVNANAKAGVIVEPLKRYEKIIKAYYRVK